MKRIKLVIICFLILLTSGCTVDYNLKINEDLSVNETVQAKESTNRMNSKTNLKGEEAVKYLYEMFKRDDSEINLSTIEKNGETISEASYAYDSLEDYSAMFSSDIFRDVSVTKNKNKISIVAIQSELIGENSLRTLVYDNVNVNINVPFDVTYNNADKKKDNVYTWNIEKNNKPKTIKIEFDIKNKKDSANIKVGENVLNIKYEYIAIFVITVIILSIVVFVAINNKKNNKI